MTDEEIRMRCLELAASIIGEVDSNQQLIDVANELAVYVKYTSTKPSQNTLIFEKINKERE
jgi:hypothetical protein